MMEESISDDSRYEPFYQELEAMIKEEMAAQGYEIDEDEDEDEE